MKNKTASTLLCLCLGLTSLPASEFFPELAPLETETLPLRVTEGKCVDLQINPTTTIHKTNTLVGGVAMTSLSRWCDGLMPFSMETGEYTLPPALEEAFIDMRLPTTRFYGIIEDEPFDTLEESLDAIALFADKLQIPRETTIIECEDFASNTKFSPEEWATAVQHSLDQKHGFRFWEVGNEVYSSIWGSTGKAFPSPEVYIEHFTAVSRAIKATQPDAAVGISVPRSNEKWGFDVLRATAGDYDFVCPHFYGGFFDLRERTFEEVVIDNNHYRIDQIVALNHFLKEQNPDRETFIYDTEWGLHASKTADKPGEAPGSADFQPKNGNIMGTLYRAVRLVYYARENLVRGACGWKSLTRLQNPGFATLYYTEPERRTMLYWLYYYFNRSLRENVVEISGTVPFHHNNPLVPVVATTNADQSQMTIMLVNGSWETTYPTTLALEGFAPQEFQAIVLSSDDLDAFPHLEHKSDFVSELTVERDGNTLVFDLPPHSIVFLEVSPGILTKSW